MYTVSHLDPIGIKYTMLIIQPTRTSDRELDLSYFVNIFSLPTTCNPINSEHRQLIPTDSDYLSVFRYLIGRYVTSE